jgi:hypothetical protein
MINNLVTAFLVAFEAVTASELLSRIWELSQGLLTQLPCTLAKQCEAQPRPVAKGDLVGKFCSFDHRQQDPQRRRESLKLLLGAPHCFGNPAGRRGARVTG